MNLEPIQIGIDAEEPGSKTLSFAIVDRAEMTALACAMPDCQSAVLFCLTWHTLIQERMHRGPLAGKRLARVSGMELANLTGRPLRTVRDALAKLKEAGLIELASRSVGRTAVYRIGTFEANESDHTKEVTIPLIPYRERVEDGGVTRCTGRVQ